MSDLLIRNMIPRMKRQLQERARANGRSLSEEATLLLGKALSTREPEQNLWDWMRNLVSPEHRGDDLVFEYPDDIPKSADLE